MKSITPFFHPDSPDHTPFCRLLNQPNLVFSDARLGANPTYLVYLQVLAMATFWSSSTSFSCQENTCVFQVNAKTHQIQKGAFTSDLTTLPDPLTMTQKARLALEELRNLFLELDSSEKNLLKLLGLSDAEFNLFFNQLSAMLPTTSGTDAQIILSSPDTSNDTKKLKLKIFSLLVQRSKDPILPRLFQSKLTQFAQTKGPDNPVDAYLKMIQLLLIPIQKLDPPRPSDTPPRRGR